MRRSLAEPKNFRAIAPIILEFLLLEAGGQASRLPGRSHAAGQIALALFVAARAYNPIVERLAIGEPFLECPGASAQLRIGERFKSLLQRVDLCDARLIALDAALVGTAP